MAYFYPLCDKPKLKIIKPKFKHQNSFRNVGTHESLRNILDLQKLEYVGVNTTAILPIWLDRSIG